MFSARARRGLAAAAVTAGALAAAGLPAAPGALAAATGAGTATVARPAGPRVPIRGTRPGWAVASRRVAARAAVTGSVRARVDLAGGDPAGLAAYATAVSDPRSGDYRHYLTAAQVRHRYGPTAAEVAAVRHWLTSSGLRITAVTPQYVAVSGPVSAVQHAFDVRFGKFT